MDDYVKDGYRKSPRMVVEDVEKWYRPGTGGHERCSIEDMQKWLRTRKRKHKDKYTRLWVEMEMEEKDEFGHMDTVLILRGERVETKKEVEKRCVLHLQRRGMEYVQHVGMAGYWASRDGQREIARFKKKPMLRDLIQKRVDGWGKANSKKK